MLHANKKKIIIITITEAVFLYATGEYLCGLLRILTKVKCYQLQRNDILGTRIWLEGLGVLPSAPQDTKTHEDVLGAVACLLVIKSPEKLEFIFRSSL